MAKRSRPMVSSVVVALLMGCLVSPENAPNTQVTQDVFSTDGYLIGAEDVLEISVWQNQDLSRTVTVRPDGVISLPLVGDVQAAGMTPQALKIEIGRKLVPYMDAPNVAVIVQQINSWRIYVQGEVRSPGVYPIRSQVALSQAITMAGGLTEFAKTS
ncbi:MAG: polysaccharide biosynthesis/export family protein, partial [Deltaproteobacteria bacterium]|nr:polysaccharide biosynthesis/export family protein [Deltaproteobacteria bacterium]